MRRTNINAVMKMVRSYLNEEIDSISFWLDFPHEVEKRYEKMCREDPEYTDMIYYYLIEGGTDRYQSLSESEFKELIQNQFNDIMDGVY